MRERSVVLATHQPDLGDIGPFANAIAGQYRIERELGSGGMLLTIGVANTEAARAFVRLLQ